MRLFAARTILILLILFSSSPPAAAAVDYQELQEDPLETAIKKLASPGGIDWAGYHKRYEMAAEKLHS